MRQSAAHFRSLTLVALGTVRFSGSQRGAVPVTAGERVSPGHCRRQFHRSLDTLSRRYRLIGVAEVRQAEDVLDGARQRVPLADGGPDKVEEVGKGSPCSRSGTGSG